MLKKPSALLIVFLFMYRVWKALTNAPSNTFLSRWFLSGIEVADFAALPQAKLPPGWGGYSSALAVLCQWEPLVHGLSRSWSSFNRRITFLSVPADHKLKGWEMMGNVWHLSQKRICQKAHYKILLPRSCCSDILESC